MEKKPEEEFKSLVTEHSLMATRRNVDNYILNAYF